jgi:cell division protein FtsZ
MINSVIDSGFEPENAVYIDTSRNAVCVAKTDNFLELGTTIFKGCGSGRNQDAARAAAELAEKEILEAMKGADTVILLAGLAGGTGGGAIPFIASLALDYIGAKTIAIVTTPAEIEGAKSQERAEQALENLKGVIDEENLYVIPTAKGALATMYANTDKLVAEKVMDLLKRL